jgi:hypothetical protein
MGNIEKLRSVDKESQFLNQKDVFASCIASLANTQRILLDLMKTETHLQSNHNHNLSNRKMLQKKAVPSHQAQES